MTISNGFRLFLCLFPVVWAGFFVVFFWFLVAKVAKVRASIYGSDIGRRFGLPFMDLISGEDRAKVRASIYGSDIRRRSGEGSGFHLWI
jgi:hypothetical protein